MLIVAFIGEDAAISQARPRFTEQTVSVVEEMISSNRSCNEAMKSLSADLARGDVFWLQAGYGVRWAMQQK